jgi:hypothetical protein
MPIPIGVLAVAGAGGGGGAAGAFELLETQTIGSGGQTSVTFSNLNSSYGSTYQHLQIRMVVRDGNANSSVRTELQFNGSATGYASHELRGNGSTVASTAATSGTFARPGRIIGGSGTANAFSAIILDILDPFETTKNTTFRALGGSTSYDYVFLTSGFWNDTAAITSIKLQPEDGVGTWAQYSRISLYGMRSS